jgi:hypothetical protein
VVRPGMRAGGAIRERGSPFVRFSRRGAGRDGAPVGS